MKGAESLPSEKIDLAVETYKTWRSYHRKKSISGTDEEAREKREDPQRLGSLLSELVSTRDWRRGIAEGTLFTDWVLVVGEDIGTHSIPLSLVDGYLTIQTTSTAWATQLTLIAPSLLKTISESAPGALVEHITVIGPGAPSWKKGIRAIRNTRGPRDTYG
jgi:predicted nucleic acid-binding Zn ribbon protein